MVFVFPEVEVCMPYVQGLDTIKATTAVQYSAIQYRTADNSTSAELNQYQYLLLSVSMKTEQHTNITFTNVPQFFSCLREKPFFLFL